MKKTGCGLIIAALLLSVGLALDTWYFVPPQAEVDWEFNHVPWTFGRALSLMFSSPAYYLWYITPLIIGILRYRGKYSRILSGVYIAACVEIGLLWFLFAFRVLFHAAGIR